MKVCDLKLKPSDSGYRLTTDLTWWEVLLSYGLFSKRHIYTPFTFKELVMLISIMSNVPHTKYAAGHESSISIHTVAHYLLSAMEITLSIYVLTKLMSDIGVLVNKIAQPFLTLTNPTKVKPS